MEFETSEISSDNGASQKQLVDLIDTVNWPIISIEALVQLLIRKNGILKTLSTVQTKIFQEMARRQHGLPLLNQKSLNLRYCQADNLFYQSLIREYEE